jgi:hypothetical protein
MKLVLYNENNEIIEVVNVEQLQIEQKENGEIDAFWNGGIIQGLKAEFIVLDDFEDTEERRVTDEMKELDKSEQFISENVLEQLWKQP